MSKNHEYYSQEHKSAPEELDIKYSIPFSWGNLHMSKEADKAYGLIPLTRTQDTHTVARPKYSITPRYEVYITSPEEFLINQYSQGSNIDPRADGWAHCSKKKHHLTVQLATSHTAESIVEERHQSQSAEFDDLINIEGMYDDYQQIPSKESLARNAPQKLMQVLVDTAAESIHNHIVNERTAKRNKELLRSTTILGAGSVFLSGVIIGPSAIQGSISPLQASAAAAGSLTMLESARRRIAGHFKNERSDQIRMDNFAQLEGKLVANSIYQTYSSDHFNAMANELLKRS